MKDIFHLDDANQQDLAAEEAESAANPWPEPGEEKEERFSGASADPIDEPEAPADIYVLSPIEVRVLACLIEKEKTVPQSYPLTLQYLTLACNQASSRDPVMQLEEGEVSFAARSLQQKGLVQSPPSARAERYSHHAHRAYDLSPAALAAICILMLRGPQTASEIFQRGKRIHPFTGKEEVEAALNVLMQRQPALACHHKSPGRGLRYIHCLLSASSPLPAAANAIPLAMPPAMPKAAPDASPTERPSIQPPSGANPQLTEALEHLNQQMERLIDRLDRLEQHLEGMAADSAPLTEASGGDHRRSSS